MGVFAGTAREAVRDAHERLVFEVHVEQFREPGFACGGADVCGRAEREVGALGREGDLAAIA